MYRVMKFHKTRTTTGSRRLALPYCRRRAALATRASTTVPRDSAWCRTPSVVRGKCRCRCRLRSDRVVQEHHGRPATRPPIFLLDTQTPARADAALDVCILSVLPGGEGWMHRGQGVTHTTC